ncbi:hypothetical protein EDD15DRAFT_2166639 [Pisolithus albus]|nr:hypothetical protein EDD15DRAFT_2166639 [Pisolithus albus]
MIWSLHHMAFGVTIENTKMRFWFSCRAIMLMSEPINFITISCHVGTFTIC